MKKIIATVCGFVFCMAALVGCAGNTEPAEEPIDYSKFPNYVNPEDAVYQFDFEQMVTPYFTGNVIYNETVMLIEENGVISGKLQYEPVKILSVRDYTWENEYSSSEYTIEGNVITMNAGGTMPYLTAENLQGKNIPEPYREVTTITNVETDWVLMGPSIYTESSLIYGHQISVSYVYDVRDLKLDDFASYETAGYPKLKEKLNAGDDAKIVAIGDSVAEGCSSSGHFDHAPYMDNWVTQATQALDKEYEGSVTVKNVALGGTQSEWGAAAAQVNKVVAESPDLVIVHFGINDAGGSVTPGTYQDNIEKLIIDVQARLPECEFMLIKAFTPNTANYNPEQFRKYWARLDTIAENYENVYTLDMYTLSQTMLTEKKYMDVTGNGINHVNDYSSRLYTMNILSALIKY